jgi:transcription initiation factor TFIIF subunit beta
VKIPGVTKPRVTLSLTEATLCLNEPGEEDIPKEHELIVASVSKQAIGVFSFENDDVTDTEKVRMEGKIQQRLECRPYADKSYIKLKVEEMKKVSQPVRQVIQLERAVQNYKPVSDHKHNVSLDICAQALFTA